MAILDARLEAIQPEASRILIRCLPQKYQAFICNLLDYESTLGHSDYHTLGEHLGCTHMQVQALKHNNVGRSVTGALLNEFQHKLTIWQLLCILSRMGVSGVLEILEFWPDVKNLYHREQEQLFGWSRHGVQNVEGSCCCENCQDNYNARHFHGHYQVMRPFSEFAVYPFDDGLVSGDAAVLQVSQPIPAHGNVYQGYGVKYAGQGAGNHAQLTDHSSTHRKSPERDGDTRRLVKQNAVDCPLMNIPSEAARAEIKPVCMSNVSVDENESSKGFFRSSSNEDNCSYDVGSEADSSHGNQNVVFEQQTVAEVHVQDRDDSPVQDGLTSSADVGKLLQELKLKDFHDSTFIPPDDLSLNDEEASMTHIPEASMAERTYEASHGTSMTQMAHLDNNGKQTLTCQPQDPVKEGKHASKVQRNLGMADVPVTHYSVPLQGYPEYQSLPSEQTMRKLPQSTTEAYFGQQQDTNGLHAPPVGCSGLNCSCGGYSWYGSPEMSRPRIIQPVRNTSQPHPRLDTQPQTFHSLCNPQRLSVLHIPQRSQRSRPLQSPPGSQASQIMQLSSESQVLHISQLLPESQALHNPQLSPESQALHNPQLSPESQSLHNPQLPLKSQALYIPQESTVTNGPDRSPGSPTLRICQWSPTSHTSPPRAQGSPPLHTSEGSQRSTGMLIPRGTPSQFNRQVAGQPDVSGTHSVHPHSDVAEQPAVPMRVARREEFGKEKRFSDPSPSASALDLQRCLSDEGIQYIYQREEEPKKFVFVTGGELRQQKKVEDQMWKICYELQMNRIPFVANLQQELFAYPGDPLKTRHKLRENIHEGMIEYFKKATCVLLVVSPGYKEYIDKNNNQASPSSHQISTRYIYTEMIDEHCRKNFCKNKRFYPVKLKALATKTEHIPDWIASTLIYNFPKNKAELIQHLTEDLSYQEN